MNVQSWQLDDRLAELTPRDLQRAVFCNTSCEVRGLHARIDPDHSCTILANDKVVGIVDYIEMGDPSQPFRYQLLGIAAGILVLEVSSKRGRVGQFKLDKPGLENLCAAAREGKVSFGEITIDPHYRI